MLDFSEAGLTKEYGDCSVASLDAEEEAVAAKLIANRARYETVAKTASVPWTLIGCIHYMESGCNFDCHLHNGDPLTARTIHVPINRPVGLDPPFTWEQSAADALDRVWKPAVWNLGSALHFLEMYNGLGYRKYNIFSPYVWSGTTAYLSGKFVADGSYDPNKVSEQMGCAAIMKELEQSGITLV